MFSRRLSSYGDENPPVHLAAIGSSVIGDRVFCAEALDIETIGRDTIMNEIAAYRLGASLGKPQITGRVPVIIGVTADHDMGIRILLEGGGKPIELRV
jgi:hypothetical protein